MDSTTTKVILGALEKRRKDCIRLPKQALTQEARTVRKQRATGKNANVSTESFPEVDTVTENPPIELESVTTVIRSLAEEGHQTSDLLELERNYSAEVIGQFKEIMKSVDASFHVNNGIGSGNFSPSSEQILTSEGVVCLLDTKGKVITRRPLEELQIDTVLSIIGEVLPEVDNRLQKKQGERLSTIEKIIKDLKKIVGADGVVQ